jgi:glycosyltransferase involved in cell wall biosynthesis
MVLASERGNIHQILKTGRCRGIIALNSNVVHDGLIWDVPAIVLGRGVWPREGWSPFMLGLPAHWCWFEAYHQHPAVQECRTAYIQHLLNAQWRLADARDARRVIDLFQNSITNYGTTARRDTVINVFAQDFGWLFEDIKAHFEKHAKEGVSIITSNRAMRNADAWIMLRVTEKCGYADPQRTIAQIHDMTDAAAYKPTGARRRVAECGGVSMTHTDQVDILEEAGVVLEDKETLVRPIGALDIFTVRETMPEEFTIGWVGRPRKLWEIKDAKRMDWFCEIVGMMGNRPRVILLGKQLEDIAERLESSLVPVTLISSEEVLIEEYPHYYHSMDCVLITSVSEGGPLCLFEALACGVPVVSTPVGWAPLLLVNKVNGYIAETVSDLLTAVEDIQRQRHEWFQRRHEIVASLGRHTMQSWIEDNIKLALRLVNQDSVRPCVLTR